MSEDARLRLAQLQYRRQKERERELEYLPPWQDERYLNPYIDAKINQIIEGHNIQVYNALTKQDVDRFVKDADNWLRTMFYPGLKVDWPNPLYAFEPTNILKLTDTGRIDFDEWMAEKTRGY